MAAVVVPPPLPPGRPVELAGRGTTFVREVPGPPGAPTLLLLHGWTASADLNWFACYEALGERFRVLALDHRGHGRGIRPRGPFRLEDCADDAAALARALGTGPVVAVGYSMGGSIAQLLWRRHRDLVGGLVLCATSHTFRRNAPERAVYLSLLGLSGVARVTPGTLSRRVTDVVLERRLYGTPLGPWAVQEMRRNHLATVLHAGWSIGCFSSAAWAGGIDVPAAVVVTTRDQVVSARQQLALAESLPDATVHRVDADHTVCATSPARFLPVLIEACERVARRAGMVAEGAGRERVRG
jgi:3-oxoadipate enol-lactonase